MKLLISIFFTCAFGISSMMAQWSIKGETTDINAPWNLLQKFSVEVRKADEFVVVGEATTIGYKRILTFDAVQTDEIRISIRDSRAAPVLSEIQLYRFPDL